MTSQGNRQDPVRCVKPWMSSPILIWNGGAKAVPLETQPPFQTKGQDAPQPYRPQPYQILVIPQCLYF
jgi:hypothetical protein